MSNLVKEKEMIFEYKNIAINALSWVREDNYIKIPNPDSKRIVYLVNEHADLFELIDEGLEIPEIIEELSKKYKGITKKKVEKAIDLFCEHKIIQITDQFEEN